MATEYEKRRAQVWMIQVRSKGTSQAWCCTSAHYFYSRKEAQEYIATQIDAGNFEYLEYRAMKYLPVGPMGEAA